MVSLLKVYTLYMVVVNLETGKLLVEGGADALVAGNAVFKAPDMKEMIHQLKNL